MWNANTFFIRGEYQKRGLLLSRDIAAIEAIPLADRLELGPIIRIPEGAELEDCGEGFNRNTAKVRWRGKPYFIFLEDIKTDDNSLAACAGC